MKKWCKFIRTLKEKGLKQTFLIQGVGVFYVGRDSSVGIATRYGLDGLGIEFRWRARFSARIHTGPEAHPASYKMCTSFPE